MVTTVFRVLSSHEPSSMGDPRIHVLSAQGWEASGERGWGCYQASQPETSEGPHASFEKSTGNPKPYINPKPETLNPEPFKQTLNLINANPVPSGAGIIPTRQGFRVYSYRVVKAHGV